MKKDKKWSLVDLNNLERDLLQDGVMSITFKGNKPRLIKKTIKMNSIPCKIIFEYSHETEMRKHNGWCENFSKKLKRKYGAI